MWRALRFSFCVAGMAIPMLDSETQRSEFGMTDYAVSPVRRQVRQHLMDGSGTGSLESKSGIDKR